MTHEWREEVPPLPPPPPQWRLDMDLRHHIQHCACTCNHMGYGNYMDYQGEMPPRQYLEAAAFAEYQGEVPPCNCMDCANYMEYQMQMEMCRAQCMSEVPQATRMVNGSARYNHQGRLIPAPRGSVTSSSSDDERLELRPWVVACLAVVVVGGIGLGIAVLLSGGDSLEEERLEMLDTVRRILTEVPLIDGHNDLPWNIKKFVHNQLGRFNFSEDLTQIDPWSKSNWSHTDLPRLKAGMVGAQFWSAYVPCGAQHMDAVQIAMEQIDVIKRLTQIYSNDLQFVTTAAEIKEAHKSGRIASLIGVEGGHSLGSSLGVLRMFQGLGARYLTLTHTCNTPWAGCCVGNDTTEPDGLAHFGRLVVRELNRLGMLVDLSHTSFRTMEHALNVSTAPVIFSHSSAFAICNSNRNVPDYILKLVALNGGIVMVNFYTYFISCNQTATMEDVIAHINHIRKVAGEDHVGIGAGYDGINTTPEGLEDVSKYPELLAALLATGDWTEDQLKKLAGLNMLRVMTRAEQVKLESPEPIEPSSGPIITN